jgi:hypothetical protein
LDVSYGGKGDKSRISRTTRTEVVRAVRDVKEKRLVSTLLKQTPIHARENGVVDFLRSAIGPKKRRKSIYSVEYSFLFAGGLVGGACS